MSRALPSVLLLCALAAPAAAQNRTPTPHGPIRGIQSVQGKPIATSNRPVGGVYSTARQKKESGTWEAAKVAALRAKFEAAKASGKVCRERLAHQEARLERLEAQYHVRTDPHRPPAGIHSINEQPRGS